jgi:hypothetical protein
VHQEATLQICGGAIGKKKAERSRCRPNDAGGHAQEGEEGQLGRPEEKIERDVTNREQVGGPP